MEKIMTRGNTGTMFFMLVLFLHLIGLSFFEVSAMPVGYTREELSLVAGYGEEKLSSVLVSGIIKCEHFNEREELVSTIYVEGAKVAVACKEEWRRKKTIWVRGITDAYGEFMLDLPSRLHGIPKLEEACVVKLLHLPKKSSCHSSHHLKRKTSIKLSSVGNSIRLYTTGTIILQNYRNKKV